MVDPEIMEFGMWILDWCSRMRPYAILSSQQLASKKYWREWVENAKNRMEQPGSNLHCDGDCLQLHDGACGRAVD